MLIDTDKVFLVKIRYSLHLVTCLFMIVLGVTLKMYGFSLVNSAPVAPEGDGKGGTSELVKCGFWPKLPLLPLLWHANAVDEN